MRSFYNTVSEKSICALSLVLIFLSSKAYSDEVAIKAQLRIDQSIVATQVDQAIAENNHFSSVLTGLKYEDELPVYIDEARYDLSLGVAESVYLNQTQTLVTQVPEIKVSGAIPRVHIFGFITKVISGAQFNIKVASECRNINYEMIFAQNTITTKFSGQASESQFSFGETQFNLNPFTCTNVQGIEAYLTERVAQTLENKSMLQQMLSSQLDKVLKQQAGLLKQSSLVAVNDWLKKIDPDLYIGDAQLNMKNNFSAVDLILKTRKVINYNPASATFQDAGREKTAFNISKSDFDFLIQNALAKKINTIQYSSDDIPEFKKLLSSRFKQFFIWPALMKRPKGLPLTLKPTLESFSTDIPTEQLQNTLNFKMQVGQWVFDSSQPMVYLRTKAQFQGNAVGGVSVLELKNSYVWDQDYLAGHNVSQRISLGLVNSAAENLIQEKINNLISTSNSSFMKKIKSLYLSADQLLEVNLELGR